MLRRNHMARHGYTRGWTHTKTRGRENTVNCGFCGKLVPRYKTFPIVKGIRINDPLLRGMPGWGNDSPEADRDSWRLVQFIRHLPKITEAECSEMEAMNPVGPMEMQEREEEARFLEGNSESPASRPPAGHKH